MSDSFFVHPRYAADQAFDRARQKAFLENVVAHLRGRPTDLLSFNSVQELIGPTSSRDLGLQQISINQIVGSVGKYQEFSRSFLPRLPRNKERWKGVFAAALGLQGLPPIDVYQISDAYFVIDGNHRVSVARQLGARTIEAYVTKLFTPLQLTSDTDLPALILEIEKAQFMEHTRLAELRPNAKVEASTPGAYKQLEDIIIRFKCSYSLNQNCEIDWDEAVTRWYDEDYTPLVAVIRASNILSQFPKNTETDLYLWIIEHLDHFISQPALTGEAEKIIKHLLKDHHPGRISSLVRSWLSNLK